MTLSRFLGEPITVEFNQAPLYAKRPACPNRFVWGDEVYEIVANLREWRDYARRGKMARNMRPENLKKAAKRGSWGVGRYYFRVQVASGRIFDIYYDRTPQGSSRRLGRWYLTKEILPELDTKD